MYIESFTLNNFRKFGERDNKVLLAYEKFRDQSKDEEINISTTSTLIIGKNNVGKTSVITALKKLTGSEGFHSADFNFEYLKEFLEEYKKDPEQAKIPQIKFTMELKIDDEEAIVSNIAPLLFLNKANFAVLHIKVVIKETEEFINELDQVISAEESKQFKLLLEAIDKVDLEILYFDNDGQEIKGGFKLKDLIEIKPIEANKLTQQNNLTSAFNKIIEHRYKRNKEKQLPAIEKEIEDINQILTTDFKNKHGDDVNKSLSKIEHTDRLEISLTSDLTHEKILSNNILVYEYIENNLTIPENQYGLGYTNLVMIIAKIIKYIEKAPEEAFTSTINIISIEEPETYMHPQMQELFIKNINSAIEHLLESQNKYVNSQIVISTHSSHILNSKIHSGNSFNYINYLTEFDGKTEVVNLKDQTIVSDDILDDENPEEDKEKKVEFLKKHIKYKVSELFYSDAVIFVEGITEEILIRNHIDNNEDLQKYYISIFNIDGAHGLVYHNLIKQLKVPTLVITDLDIKIKKTDDKDQKETDEEIYKQVTNLKDRKTTNKTLTHYFSEELDNFEENDNLVGDNMYLAFQKKQCGFYPTSFEEALILSNYKNDILKAALGATKPQIYKNIHNGDDENLREYSRLLQKKLSDSKSEFTNRLLTELVIEENDDDSLNMPNYIAEGLKWLKCQLKGGVKNVQDKR